MSGRQPSHRGPRGRTRTTRAAGCRRCAGPRRSRRCVSRDGLASPPPG
jgi:hypothetical protein